MIDWDKKIKQTANRNRRKNEYSTFSKNYDSSVNKIYFPMVGIFALVVLFIIAYIVFISLTGEAKLGF